MKIFTIMLLLGLICNVSSANEVTFQISKSSQSPVTVGDSVGIVFKLGPMNEKSLFSDWTESHLIELKPSIFHSQNEFYMTHQTQVQFLEPGVHTIGPFEIVWKGQKMLSNSLDVEIFETKDLPEEGELIIQTYEKRELDKGDSFHVHVSLVDNQALPLELDIKTIENNGYKLDKIQKSNSVKTVDGIMTKSSSVNFQMTCNQQVIQIDRSWFANLEDSVVVNPLTLKCH